LEKQIPLTLLTEDSNFQPVLSEREARLYAERLKALADPTRLLMLNLLAHHKGQVAEGRINVSKIVDAFNLAQPTISHHLRILKNAGIIDFWKVGLTVHYYINEDVFIQLFDALSKVFETLATSWSEDQLEDA
jgi:ArsR family transcriptional regulator